MATLEVERGLNFTTADPDSVERVNSSPELEELFRLIRQHATLFPVCPDATDANLRDAYWLALQLEEPGGMQLGPSVKAITDKQGVAIIEILESSFIRAEEIRELSPTDVALRLTRALARIWPNVVDFTPRTLAPIVLYMWHGCLMMGKVLRETYRNPHSQELDFKPYTADMRWRGYDVLMATCKFEEARGNPWVTAGVGLNRLFEKHRNNLVVEYWIPSDSPYWG